MACAAVRGDLPAAVRGRRMTASATASRPGMAIDPSLRRSRREPHAANSFTWSRTATVGLAKAACRSAGT